MVKLEFESRPSIAHAETLGKLPISYKKKVKFPKSRYLSLPSAWGRERWHDTGLSKHMVGSQNKDALLLTHFRAAKQNKKNKEENSLEEKGL